MKPIVTTHKLFGHRDLLHEVKHLAPAAMKLVGRSVPGRMPRVHIIVSNARGMAELATDAEFDLAGANDERMHNRRRRWHTGECRKADGIAVLASEGTALVLLNAGRHHSSEDVAVTLVHELTHAMQFSRRGVLERHTAYLRDAFDIEPQSWLRNHAHERHVRQEEAEAYATEFLAEQLLADAAA
ncbi:hypothetical protein ACFP1Z_25410 [Streptomyces gamaensis]|uniref:SprT-like domain-containing protein n=1 Tax=Streptomyces gamaensis TaxID=1763542 RepID=A0ABW0Z4Z8_9ACTN